MSNPLLICGRDGKEEGSLGHSPPRRGLSAQLCSQRGDLAIAEVTLPSSVVSRRSAPRPTGAYPPEGPAWY